MAGSGWQLSANGPESYQHFLVPVLFERWTADLLDTVGALPRTILDLACGTGVVTRALAERSARAAGTAAGGRIVGADVNKGMLDVAARTPTAAPVDWVHTDAGRLDFADASFELVTCQQGFQYFSDRATAAAEMHRVLAPGGSVALSVWKGLDDQPFFAGYVDGLRRHLPPEVVALQEAAFALGDPETVVAFLRDAGFVDVQVRPRTVPVQVREPHRFFAGFLAASPLAPTVDALSDDRKDALVSDIVANFDPDRDGEGIVAPTVALLYTAKRS